jgi:glutamate/tyrosine decarboxylase-like PLP-dependent enzyme
LETSSRSWSWRTRARRTPGPSIPSTQSRRSRRFKGLQLFLSLLVAGWDGFEAAVRHQVKVARHLASELRRKGWEVVNDPALAVVCFNDGTRADRVPSDYLEARG